MKLGVWIEGMDARMLQGTRDLVVTGITCDSREVRTGWAFVALKGDQSDGAEFIGKAVEQGAAVILTDRHLNIAPEIPLVILGKPRETMALLARKLDGEPDTRMALIGVTGTNGKTTTTMLIRQLLRASGKGCGLVGTVMNAAGETEEEAVRTSPESPVFYRWLKRSVEAGDAALAVEVSSHALELQRVHGARFRVGVFTNLTQDHLDFHGDMESYFMAKKKLFAMSERILVNLDDAYGQRLLKEWSSCGEGLKEPLTRSYGIEQNTDYRITDLQLSPTGTSFALRSPNGVWEIHSPLLGRFNAYNLLAALAAISEAGFDLLEILPAVIGLKGAPGRLDRVDCGQPFGVMVDYAHTPDALEKLLVEGKRLLPPGGRLHVLFGCGGDRDRTKRPIMAAAVAKDADVIWHSSDNTRTEDPERMLDDAAPGIPEDIRNDPARYHRIADRALAVKAAIADCRPGDFLLLAGKGHEPYQDVMGVKHPYSDRAAVDAVLHGREVPRPWAETVHLTDAGGSDE